MAIQISVKSIEEVPEEMREFVTEQDGVFSYDNDRAFKALKDEREISKTAKSALAPFKALIMTPEQLAEFVNLGKTPAELSELIQKVNKPQPKPDFTKTTEYLEQQKQINELLKFKERSEALEAETLKNKRNDLVRAAVRALPDKVDKELFGSLVEETLFDRFSLNETKDKLNPVGDKLPEDFLLEFAEKYRCIKPSTPGKAAPGNASIGTQNTDYETAKKNGDTMGMLAHAPEFK